MPKQENFGGALLKDTGTPGQTRFWLPARLVPLPGPTSRGLRMSQGHPKTAPPEILGIFSWSAAAGLLRALWGVWTAGRQDKGPKVYNPNPSCSLQELFCVCGALKRARLVHPGVAEVVFVKKDDAITAYKKYNNRCLDGKSGRKQPPHLPTAHCGAAGLRARPSSELGGRTPGTSSVWMEGFLRTKNRRACAVP